MLLTFEGKGCGRCPFTGITIGLFGQRTSTCMLSYNLTLRHMQLADDERLPPLEYNLDNKPKDCPFAQYPNTLEIQADEG
jgi:hypothetical protein